MKTNTFLGISIISILVLYILNRESTYALRDRIGQLEYQLLSTETNSAQNNVTSSKQPPIVLDLDKQRYENVLEPPLSRNMYTHSSGKVVIDPNESAGAQRRGLPINISTRGDGGDYQQLGILYKEDIQNNEKAPGNNTDNPVLALFGKRTYGNSNQWNYYTASDSNHQIKIPLNKNGKNCTDDLGCSEIYEGDSIDIPAYNGTFKANIYKLDKPQYIPYIT